LPNGRRKLIKKIRERFQYINSFSEIKRQATAFHKELSEIHQIKTIITTNWDTYFEEYCGASSITIPEDFTLWDEHLRHVIKIHGSMSNIGSIIATTKDYEKCYLSLQNGIIGATLKNLLATKTVVFIGFSFGDEDFDQILKYLCDEMGDLFPHIYTVSLDKSLKDKLDYGKTSTPFSDDERDLGNMPKEEFLLALQNSVKLTLPYIKFRGYVLVFIKDFQPDKKEINMLHAEVASILNEIPELNYKGMKIWADKSTKPYPYGYPFSFVANQIHQYILIFRKEK